MADQIVVMDEGCIEQIGAHQIYDRPRTRFVANFIGTWNFFEGAIVSTNKGVAMQCPNGLELPVEAASSPSGHGTLFDSPEKIDFVEVGVSAALPGIVQEVVLLNMSSNMLSRLADSGNCRVQAAASPGVPERRAGETV